MTFNLVGAQTRGVTSRMLLGSRVRDIPEIMCKAVISPICPSVRCLWAPGHVDEVRLQWPACQSSINLEAIVAGASLNMGLQSVS